MVETDTVADATTGSHTAARDAILAFIAARNPGMTPDTLTGATSLVTSDALDSIGVLDLMMDLGERFGFDIEDDSFDLAHFESIDALARYVDGRRLRS